MTKNKRITIQLEDGSTMTATVLYHSGDNITVMAANGYIREIDRNIRNDDGAYVVI